MNVFRAKFDPNTSWFISDYHGYHLNICRGTSKWDKGYRDFDTIEDMNRTLIINTNKVVQPDHTLFCLGDVCFGNREKNIPAFMGRINCKNVHLIFGNHDDYIRKHPILWEGDYPDGNGQFTQDIHPIFKSAQDYLEIFVGNKLVCLSHYSMKIWNEKHHGSYMLYGHSHGTLPDDPNDKSIDVGVDTDLFGHAKFTPYSFSEIDKIMREHKNRETKPLDHHNSQTNWS